MALNPFIGWTQAELETELRRAQEELAAGKTNTSVNSADVGASSSVQVSIERRIELLYKALYALDPATYPIASIARNDRTTPAFWDSDDTN